MRHITRAACCALLMLGLASYATPASGFFTMVMAQAQSCAGTMNDADGAVGQPEAGVSASSSGLCFDGSASSADASATASVALGQIEVSGNGSGFQEFNGSFAQASFSERLTIENVPPGIDVIDVRIVIAFVGTPPEAAFYNSASFDGYVNPQGLAGDVRLQGCSGDLCSGGVGPVRSETLDQTISVPRNGLGQFGNFDVFMDARFAIADASSAIGGTISVDVPGVPDAMIVSESGVFGTGGADSDGDGVPDASDNCTLVANPAQIDSDGDGFGNFCDADLNNDCVINTVDLGLFRAAFFSADADADLNGDGVVNTLDLGLLRAQFFGSPGPSQVAVICASL